MLLKKLRAKLRSSRNQQAKVATASLAHGTFEPTLIPLAAITDVVLPMPVVRKADDHIGMQGYAPRVSLSENRRYCEYCGERVMSQERHICWGNAEHHLHTLTAEERTRILAQLASKPRKLTRAQLRKLYSTDRLGPAHVEGQRYGN